MNKTLNFLVSGRVQGVCFRMETRQKAEQYAIVGWVRNTPDGKVEGVASGDESKLADFHNWLQQGPPMADVTGVRVEELEYQEFDEFSIRY